MDAAIDPSLHGTTAQNAELIAAAWFDAVIDAPVWAANKVLGTTIPDPVDVASHVYASQAAGYVLDANGDPYSREEILAAAKLAESTGLIVDAAKKTAQDVSNNPLSIVPEWAWFLGAAALALVVIFYALSIAKVIA